MTQKELDRHVFGDGGLFAYLGTRDLMEVERRIDAGDGRRRQFSRQWSTRLQKSGCEWPRCLKGKVDAVLLTGGMAHSERLVERLRGMWSGLRRSCISRRG
jgi:butyrate kinase